MTNKNQPRAKGVPAAMQKPLLLSLCMSMCAANLSWAENPTISQTYTADPAARVFNDRMYVIISHDPDNATDYS
ncbi:MAG TPA: hypothetical protein PK129_15805, partial [Cellvibrionaceae bacterium]|nr:hypothetical protein [Cellvibrionaceae bacterium]